MESNNPQNLPNVTFAKLVETIIRLAVLFVLLGWCLYLLRPFAIILIWAAVIAIAIYPLYGTFITVFRNRKTLASVVLTFLMVSILIVPSWLVIQSLFQEVSHLHNLYSHGKLIIPPPGEGTANWPAIAKPIIDVWKLASDNLQSAMTQYADQLRKILAWLFAAASNIGTSLLQFLASIIIAGVLLAYSSSVGNAATNIFIKLLGKNGEIFARNTVATIRSVIKGILGVAVIQATMAGLGYFIAGVPYAALWTIASLFFAIIQIGAGPVAIPVIIYMFSVTDTLTAVLLAIWLVITLISDNVLKPILLGRGAPAPMLVVFLGAIGGFISIGFLGLFLGAVVLTIGYNLFIVWLDSSQTKIQQ